METAKDFNEDPFKNYRYEDPFLISDPFQEEEAPAAVVKGKIELQFFWISNSTKSFKQKQNRKLFLRNSHSMMALIHSQMKSF